MLETNHPALNIDIQVSCAELIKKMHKADIEFKEAQEQNLKLCFTKNFTYFRSFVYSMDYVTEGDVCSKFTKNTYIFTVNSLYYHLFGIDVSRPTSDFNILDVEKKYKILTDISDMLSEDDQIKFNIAEMNLSNIL